MFKGEYWIFYKLNFNGDYYVCDFESTKNNHQLLRNLFHLHNLRLLISLAETHKHAEHNLISENTCDWWRIVGCLCGQNTIHFHMADGSLLAIIWIEQFKVINSKRKC